MTPTPNPSASFTDRAVGAILGSAAGDALGAPYEFKPSLPDDVPVRFTAGGPWNLGEWTDDTSMAVPILQAVARGEALTDAATRGRIVAEWQGWAVDAKDVGIQTRQVLALLSDSVSEHAARAAALAVHERTGRSAGNGSLMRTGPVALAFLADGQELALADTARRISELTHHEVDAGDGCVIWSLAIRHAIRTGELDLRAPIGALPAERRDRWHAFVDVAERTAPRDIPGSNGWVVAALQAAWSAIHHARLAGEGLQLTLERAVRCGNDTDTVAAIAGSLAGAAHGASAVPAPWRRELHGWPGLRADDLEQLALLAVRRGSPDQQR
ncbi:ADP-ribosylglycohydrolase family protein [Agromyces allii]|uniref:ADP-ribosylglycohydrolase family protein n=1 Tax=Agromyces allii TaxID=393607 RepID=A0ABP5BAP7_9MICO|nr:ADP-ribosylglycohydrolase family protein [Agromyces allii]